MLETRGRKGRQSVGGSDLKKILLQVGKMAQQVKVLAAKPDDLCSNPRTSLMEREN